MIGQPVCCLDLRSGTDTHFAHDRKRSKQIPGEVVCLALELVIEASLLIVGDFGSLYDFQMAYIDMADLMRQSPPDTASVHFSVVENKITVCIWIVVCCSRIAFA